MQNLGLHMADDKAAGGIDMLNHFGKFINYKQQPIALCIDFASA